MTINEKNYLKIIFQGIRILHIFLGDLPVTLKHKKKKK